MQGGRGSLGQRLAGLLASRARGVLVSGWGDYYSGEYEWAVRKAWEAASVSTLQWDPSGSYPVSWRLLSSSCPAAAGIASSAVYLDGLYLIVSNPWIGMVAGWELTAASKADALDAIEEAIRVLDAVEACGPLAPPAPEADSQAGLRFPHAFRIGPILVIVEEGFEGIPVAERLRSLRASLPPGYYPVVLTGDEALALIHTPLAAYYASMGEVEALWDETGMVGLILSGVPQG